MLRASSRFPLLCYASSSSSSSSPQHIIKDLKLSNRRLNPADQRKRLVVLIDSDLISVQTYFTRVEPLIRTINSNNVTNEDDNLDEVGGGDNSNRNKSNKRVASSTITAISNNVVLLHRVFFQQSVFRPEWQQVVLHRSDHFESFKVQRFISMHLQMVADGAHIAQLRLKNRVEGVVFVTDQTQTKLYCDQIVGKRKDAFEFVDKYVVYGEGAIMRTSDGDTSSGFDGFALKKRAGE